MCRPRRLQAGDAPCSTDIADPLWGNNVRTSQRMAAMWGLLRALRLACSGLLLQLDKLHCRCAGSFLVAHPVCWQSDGLLCLEFP